MAKIIIAVWVMICISFFCSEKQYALADSAQGCISLGEFFRLPGEMTMEPVSIELPEFKGRFERVATRMKKHTEKFDITLLVFDRNKKPELLFERVTSADKKESIFVFNAGNTCVKAHSNIFNFQPVYHFASSPGENDKIVLLGMRFFLAEMGPNNEPILFERTFLLEKPVIILNPLVEDKEISKQSFHNTGAETTRKISVSVYVENQARETLCKNRTKEECRVIIQALFEPTKERFLKEFGIVVAMNDIIFDLPIHRGLGFSADDKGGMEIPHMYHYGLNVFAEILRKDSPNIDVVAGIAEGLPDGSSDLASSYYGTILMNARDPFIERSIVHELGHMFCAEDNRYPHAIMNGYGTNIQDKFLKKDIEIISRNKYRKFSYDNLGRSHPYSPCK
ncbi:MAG: hypothetical protein Q8O83_02430 [bacterium]|nr:hypothetical protein [bacterium]